MIGTTSIAGVVVKALADAALCETSDLKPETSLRDGDLLDSLETFEAVVDIEDELGLTITDEDLEKAETVGDLIALCERHVAMAKAARGGA